MTRANVPAVFAMIVLSIAATVLMRSAYPQFVALPLSVAFAMAIIVVVRIIDKWFMPSFDTFKYLTEEGPYRSIAVGLYLLALHILIGLTVLAMVG